MDDYKQLNDEDLKELILSESKKIYHGDGKIFISPVEDVYRIRTGENRYAAL